MTDILRRAGVVGIDILKVLLSGKVMTPKQIARALDVEPFKVRNALVHLKTLEMVNNIHYGEYTLTELGREYLELVSQPSQDQSSRRETQ